MLFSNLFLVSVFALSFLHNAANFIFCVTIAELIVMFLINFLTFGEICLPLAIAVNIPNHFLILAIFFFIVKSGSNVVHSLAGESVDLASNTTTV